MKSILKIAFIILVVSCFSCQKEQKVTLESLLIEMADRKEITYFPEPVYSQKQFSSYDRRSIHPDSADWFANRDCSSFIRVEETKGRREFVMVDVEGPGAISRIWVTFQSEEIKEGIMRFYFDNETTPRIEGPVAEVIGGTQLTGSPLSYESPANEQEAYQHGSNLYLPIPYETHLKITYESPALNFEEVDIYGDLHTVWNPCFFYNINYRTYSGKTAVSSFSLAQLRNVETLIADVQKKLGEKIDLKGDSNLKDYFELAPGEEQTMHFFGDNKVIELLKLEMNNNNMLDQIDIELAFDGQTTVEMKLDEFFGTHKSFIPYKSRYLELTNEQELISAWPMPFKNKAELRLKNNSSLPVKFGIYASVNKYKWQDNSMYFHAQSKSYKGAKTGDKEGRKPWDLNFIDLKGQGVFAGDCICIDNPVSRDVGWPWWGEGDEKIYIDGEEFPSHFGTGTEDYYGYAWALPYRFSHPFIAQPIGEGNLNSGLAINLRQRSLDAIPFTKELKVDMELWHHTVTRLNYGVSTYFYKRKN